LRTSVVVLAGVFGLLIGSAINAMVWRLYVGRSWVRGRSECPDCGHKLAARDLVPVVSWVMLGGRCRYCGKRIHWQYPVVELLTAGLFALSAAVLEPGWWRLGVWLVMLVMLIVLAVYDLRWMILPDKITLPLVVVALGYSVVTAGLAGSVQVLWGALVAGGVAGGAFLGLVAVTRGRAMGGGDVKLAAGMGLMLGVQATAVAMLVAFNAAAVVGLGLIVAGRRTRKDEMPFGPFLVAGTVVAFLFGRALVAWYLRLNGV
jgi:leader peptidase (prepilin peptidase) / N-methyltransferase